MAYTTIDDGSAHFEVTIWTGTGGARTISGLNHKPDLIWTKTRSVAYNHMLSDSSRGFNANSELGTNSSNVEGGLSAETYGYKSGHTSDGWTMVDGTDTVDSQEDGNTNQPSVTYVGWTWKANGGTRTTFTESGNNPGGGYQANTTGGFSIVDYTGTGSAGTVSHGLGAVPHWIVVKGREHSGGWITYHHKNTDAPETDILEWQSTAATYDSNTYWNDTAPTSSVFTVNTSNDTNNDGNGLIAYVWTEIQGFSKFGRYTGNGNADGPFVYTGFKPKWLMIKRTNNTEHWKVNDTVRDTNTQYGNDASLHPNQSIAETTSSSLNVDFLSNGFKLVTADGASNAVDAPFVYMCFAEHPFVSSKGVPATAR